MSYLRYNNMLDYNYLVVLCIVVLYINKIRILASKIVNILNII
jgi:hypothetical protein